MSARDLPPSSHTCGKCGVSIPYFGRRDLASAVVNAHNALSLRVAPEMEALPAIALAIRDAKRSLLPAFLSLAGVCAACFAERG